MDNVDQTKYNELFLEQKDSSIQFRGKKLEVLIPDYYVDKKISTFIGRELETLGIFDAYYYDPEEANVSSVIEAFKNNDMNDYDKSVFKKITFTIPSNIILTPTNIEERTFSILDDESDINELHTFYCLEFTEYDTFIKTINVIKSVPALKSFIHLLFGGFMPSNLSYEDILKTWEECNVFNGAGDLGVSNAILAMIVSEIVRDKNNLGRPYRLRLNGKESTKFNGKLIRVMELPKHILPFAALTSADPKHGITLSISREKQGLETAKTVSQLEKDIS